MTKKIAPKGAYDRQFDRSFKRSGKWRGRVLYKKYKAKKKVRPEPYIKFDKGFEVLVVPDGIRSGVLIWGKINYSNKLSI